MMKPINDQIEEYLEYCQYTRNMTSQTLKSKRHILEQFMQQTGISDFQNFNNLQLNKWIESAIKAGISGRTVNTRLAHIVAFSKYLKDMDYKIILRYTLIKKVKEAPPRRIFYTREQIETVKAQATTMEWLLISMKFDSGLRLTELTNLRLENVKGTKLRFIGKGRTDRTSFISEETRLALDEWVNDHGIDDYLWPSPMSFDRKPYHIDEIRRIMRKAFKRAGFDDFYPHSLRHSFGTDLERNGAPITVTQKLMGHASVDTTQKYLHGLDNKMEEIYQQYKPSRVNSVTFA